MSQSFIKIPSIPKRNDIKRRWLMEWLIFSSTNMKYVSLTRSVRDYRCPAFQGIRLIQEITLKYIESEYLRKSLIWTLTGYKDYSIRQFYQLNTTNSLLQMNVTTALLAFTHITRPKSELHSWKEKPGSLSQNGRTKNTDQLHIHNPSVSRDPLPHHISANHSTTANHRGGRVWIEQALTTLLFADIVRLQWSFRDPRRGSFGANQGNKPTVNSIYLFNHLFAIFTVSEGPGIICMFPSEEISFFRTVFCIMWC